MQETTTAYRRQRFSLFVFKMLTFFMLLVIISTGLLHSDVATAIHARVAALAADRTVATNGADLWSGDRKTTVPDIDFSEPGKIAISPLFTYYYTQYHGATNLGKPLTDAFPTVRGWMQVFELGILLVPAPQPLHTLNADDQDALLNALIIRSIKNSGVLRLSLLQILLSVGSLEPIGGSESDFTYADLRAATNPGLMRVEQSGGGLSHFASGQGVFVKGGTRAGKNVGYQISSLFWNYMQRPDVSPDGWETDFGAPLTSAISFVVSEADGIHEMQVQAFWNDALLLDYGGLNSSARVQRLDTGLAYLRTFSLPDVAVASHQSVWVQHQAALFDAPVHGQPVAHVGLDYPLTLLGDTVWNNGMLWYHVQWNGSKYVGTGWIAASSITFTSPGHRPGWASFDILSPDLANYLNDIGENVNAVVYDLTRQRYYTYHPDTQFVTGSSIKVPIMLALLDMTEQEGREPDGGELGLLSAMIENSDNDSAGQLYLEIGNSPALADYMQKIGISGLVPNYGAFGWSLISPLAMVNILTALYQGRILTRQDRALALNLMENIEADQQIGVGDTAPPGATVAMKDGWVVEPDGLWAMNSSGIVMDGHETYIIAVYTQDQETLQDGQAITEHICGAIASLLA